MSYQHIFVFFATLFTMFVLLASPTAAQQSCESLTGLSLLNTTITTAKSVPAGRKGTVDLPAYCQVAGVIKPTADSEIKFEVWMPASGWNGRFQDLGNGGYAGSIPYVLLAPELRRGYAAAGTDDGHTGGGDPTWAIQHPEKVIDFGYRAVHLTAENGKAIVQAFYGRPPERSYFAGCSDGGREALMEAQRFPADFDGIIAGAPANYWTHLFAGFIWNAQAMHASPASAIPENKLSIIQAGALAACDALDGVKDGVIDDPRRCHFDPATLQCKDADGPDCLTAAQVEAVKKIYGGPVNTSTGEQIFPGYEPGAEAAAGNWSGWIISKGPAPSLQFFFGNTFFADMVFENPKWDFRTLNFDTDVRVADTKLGPVINSTNPDLSPFRARGGKLIQYHGWADAAIAPVNSINYYESVVADVRSKMPHKGKALKQTQDFYRLFMVPGLGHCAGGPGPNSFGNLLGLVEADAQHDVVGALEQWVEHGQPPDKIVATKYVDDKPEKGVVRTRPLCPYPEEAKWTGKGSTDDAANFVCRLPRK